MTLNRIFIQRIIFIVCALTWRISGSPIEPNDARPGRYVPDLYGSHRGKYVPDDSGKYVHIPNPYDGGYGDSGLRYEHDDNRYIHEEPVTKPFKPPLLSLGPHDHLRFMIDFNYNNSGWQIIQFEWIRDGDESHQYNYVNENQLWFNSDRKNSDGTNYKLLNIDARQNALQKTVGKDELENVHVEGDYDAQNYNVTITQEEPKPAIKHTDAEVRSALDEILDYIQRDILPNLP